MRSLATLCVSLCVLGSVLAVGCGDDDSDADGAGAKGGSESNAGSPGDDGGTGGTPGGGGTQSNGGEPGETGGSGGTGTGGSDGGSGGLPGGGGPNGGGSGGDGGSAGGGGGGELGVACADFPATVTPGPTISLTTKGAIVCLDTCRLTTNTYSDGAGACAQNDGKVSFFVESDNTPTNRASLLTDWEWLTTTAGTIHATYKYSLDDVPADTSVTATLKAADDTEFTVVFTFEANGDLTVTSFAED